MKFTVTLEVETNPFRVILNDDEFEEMSDDTIKDCFNTWLKILNSQPNGANGLIFKLNPIK